MAKPLVRVSSCSPELPPGPGLGLGTLKALGIPPAVEMCQIVLAANMRNANVARERTLKVLRVRTKWALCGDVVSQRQGRALHQRSVRTMPLNKVPEPFCVASRNLRNRRR